MAGENLDGKNRYKDSTRLAILLAVTAGILFGFRAVFMKSITQTIGVFDLLSGENWATFLNSLSFMAIMVSQTGGIIALAGALRIGRVSIVGPVTMGFVLFVPVVLGLTYFGETLNLCKAIGILMISVGSIGLAKRR